MMLMAVVVNGYSNIGGIRCVLLFQGCAPTQRQWTVEFKGGRLQFNNHKNYHNINRGSVDSLSIQLINELIFLLFGLEGVFIV